MIIPVKRK